MKRRNANPFRRVVCAVTILCAFTVTYAVCAAEPPTSCSTTSAVTSTSGASSVGSTGSTASGSVSSSISSSGVSATASSPSLHQDTAVGTIPRLTIDTPTPDSANTAGGKLQISGWALGSGGVSKVTVSIDGTVAADNIPVDGARPDVNNAFPGYTDGATSGYATAVDISGLSFGEHKLTVSATLNSGSAGAQSTVTFVKQSPLLTLDWPVSGTNLQTGSVQVSGWALTYAGQPNVDIYLDNNHVATVTANGSRPDVGNAYPGYPSASASGFGYTLNIAAAGSHTVAVRITSDGQTETRSATINVSARPSLMTIDAPGANACVNSSQMQVSGWTLGDGGVQSVTISVDGAVVQTNIPVNGARPDVNNAFPGYTGGAASGYAAAVDISGLSFGSHKLTVSATLNNGSAGAQSTVTFVKQSPLLTLDWPASGASMQTGSVQVSGWALTYTGQPTVSIYLDNKKVGSVTANRPRADVGNAFPSYPSASASGFDYTLDITSAGSHTVSVQVTSDGQTETRSATVNVSAKPSLVTIDAPGANACANSSQMQVSGWALGDGGVQSVTFSIDGAVVQTNIPVNGARPDVNNAFPGYTGGATSGYAAAVDISSLSFGEHKLTVSTTLNNGSAGAQSTVTFIKPSPYLTLDAPANGANLTSNTVQVSGWALSYAGQPNVDIYLDGNKMATVTANNPRADVGNVFPTYTYAAYSGFSYVLQNVAGGTHQVKVQFTSDNGTTMSVSVTVTVPGLVTVVEKPFDTTLNLLAGYNGVTPSSIDPNLLFADAVSKYEFMSLYGMQGVTADDINEMLTNCGVLTGQGQAVVDAAARYNINPVYLAAHMRVETGNGTSTLAKGVQVTAGTYTDSYGRTVTVAASGTYYNLLGIHADDASPVTDGSEYAASQNWNTVAAAIAGGAQWISRNYINNSQLNTVSFSGYYDQPTLYEMKWDPEGTALHNARGSSEYATDEDWAFSIAKIMAQYSDIFTDKNVTFYLPQFNS
ncbi:Ig-like domain-containing protein [Ethanoligenens harbinense]|uniref:Mannosyl-glycoprotein endo-beta-N-acetylglucosaminidase n=1 Tax=Ethanoligenens harbinense (strain DSM 18485 / JCM 12961 / CGMCC 1.5033 / YUAN-3) TaxID=663278 RepID=E6U6Z9_ETHHY|nr:Ig-like domain-containing protein [Ethanoligenens harbinense]ADU26966.1 Mannosyl-glycoprotein endo-beta-N-acetylglucosaminidase [Ethanoligenens harbinense YUAN-3]AVQ96056.1 hypothetical protein CXQ68_07355 [Ethanoligenens harbinense YUAN-3]AYF38717.1 hypothetical protein CXP51_07225 [Ethanoligenens harbinense]AYF41464.1 hypothetical protein CN246_07365 [Ethanoligenens harbinense]QCN92298.1 hypothetical protein DRA42_07385 [Ethanoligenens harbinense]